MNSRKAQIFTLMAIALIIIIFISYEIFSIVDERGSVKTRISTMENFLLSLERDMSRQMYITGFRTIFLAMNKITETGSYIPDINSLFNETFFNGTVYGNSSEILLGARYQDFAENINEKAGKINVNITLSEPEISVVQEDPWHVTVLLKVNLIMLDKNNLASWDKQENITAQISVEEFEDPLYIVKTNARVVSKINKTIYDGNYTSGIDVSNLLSHVNLGLYAENPSAPGFLKRLEGDFSPDINGIESLVNLNKLSQQGMQIYDKSAVDYIYFSSENPSSFRIQNMPSWFRLDEAHLAKYNCTSLKI